jgi:hypothetical protein
MQFIQKEPIQIIQIQWKYSIAAFQHAMKIGVQNQRVFKVNLQLNTLHPNAMVLSEVTPGVTIHQASTLAALHPKFY